MRQYQLLQEQDSHGSVALYIQHNELSMSGPEGVIPAPHIHQVAVMERPPVDAEASQSVLDGSP